MKKGVLQRLLKMFTTTDEVLEAEVQLLRSSYQNKETNLDGIFSKYATFFSRRDVWRPLIITFGLFLLQQFCGLSTISYYAVDVLASSHSSIDKVRHAYARTSLDLDRTLDFDLLL